MSNLVISALAAPLWKRPPADYHPPIQTGLLYGGHFFTPWAIPGPLPMPESHSP